MIYDQKSGLLFLHVPRTGGTSIMHALARRLPGALIDNAEGKHETGAWWRDRLGQAEWDQMRYRFCVIRDPWSMVESDFRNTLRAAKIMSDDPLFRLRVPLSYQHYIRRVAALPNLDAFWYDVYERVERYQGGIYRHFCLDCDGHDLGIVAHRYDEQSRWWPDVCRAADLPRFALPKLNAGGQWPQARWNPDLVARIGTYFAADVERFGFEPPSI